MALFGALFVFLEVAASRCDVFECAERVEKSILDIMRVAHFLCIEGDYFVRYAIEMELKIFCGFTRSCYA